MLRSLWWCAALLATLVVVPRDSLGDEKSPKLARETVELFAAVKAGDLEVSFVPRSSENASVVIKNKTKRPLSVKLPEAFAGVPALAQGFGAPGGGFFGAPGAGLGGPGGALGGPGLGGGANQAVGGGFGPGPGAGPGAMGRGWFNIGPEKARKISVKTVCLEHGKKDPHQGVKYALVPLETVTSSAAVAEVCKLLGSGAIDQRSAQVAAWHFTDALSWQALANKTIRHANGATEPYFSRSEVVAGMRIATAAHASAKAQAATAQAAASVSGRR